MKATIKIVCDTPTLFSFPSPFSFSFFSLLFSQIRFRNQVEELCLSSDHFLVVRCIAGSCSFRFLVIWVSEKRLSLYKDPGCLFTLKVEKFACTNFRDRNFCEFLEFDKKIANLKKFFKTTKSAKFITKIHLHGK